VAILPPVVLFFRAKDLLLPDFEHDFLRWVSQEAGDDKFAESVGDEASLSNILIIVNFFALQTQTSTLLVSLDGAEDFTYLSILLYGQL